MPVVATLNGVWANLKGSYKCDYLTDDNQNTEILLSVVKSE
jgi:hypothetical protein